MSPIPTFVLLSDFALQLALLLLVALTTTPQGERDLAVASPLRFALPQGRGVKPPQDRAWVIDFDGERLALGGEVLGPSAAEATLGELQRRLAAAPRRRVLVRMPESDYTRLRRTLEGRDVGLLVRAAPSSR